MRVPDSAHLLTSTTDVTSQSLVGVALVLLFVLLTLEKAHRVLIALGTVSILWLITYFTPWHLITFEGAVQHIDFNVLLLLAGMMALVGVLRATGAFEVMVSRLLTKARGEPERLVTLLIWFTGIVSALADNVTTVIFTTPLAIGAARLLGIRPVAVLLPMVFASNIGGTATLIGDPPNIMIGSGAGLTFVDFLVHLTAPVFVMLVMLQWFTLRHFAADLVPRQQDVMNEALSQPAPTITGDPWLLRGLLFIGTLVLIGFLTHGITGMPAAVPAVIGAGAALVLQDALYLRTHDATVDERAHGILKVLEHEIEWPTLAFFTFLFIIVGAAVETGLVERIATALRDGITAAESGFGLSPRSTVLFAALLVLWSSAVLSSLIDNIPFVAVSIPIIHGLLPSLSAGADVLWWALALGACLGGNGTPVGASANVTSLGLAERAGAVISFKQFLSSSVPITIWTLLVATLYLVLFVLVNRNVALAAMAVVGVMWMISNRVRATRLRASRAAAAYAAMAACLIVGSVFAPTSVHAQSPTPWRTVRQDQLWLAAVVDQPITQRLAFLGDAQWRRTDGIAKPQQLLTRGTLTYRVTPGLRLGVGLNYVATAPYGALPSARPLRDRQVFYLAQFNQKLGKLDVMHRYRFENRWLADVLENSSGEDSLSRSRFGQRTRYLLRAQYPVARLTMARQPVLAIVQNDLFVGLAGADRGASVDQNRFSFGAGLPLSARQRLDVLWLQQWVAVPRARANEQNRTLWIVLNHTGKAR